jgi:osmotically-inducible protein OsmY
MGLKIMSIHTRLFILLLAGYTIALQGCAGAMVVGAATAGVMVNDRRTTGAFVDDQMIELKVGDTIRGDEELHGQSHLNATSFNAIVLLTGETPSPDLKTRAVELTKDIDAVRQVHDEIKVAAPSSWVSRSGDTWITSKVKTALINEDTDMATRTKVVTEQGIVYLMGIVTPAESETATEVARRVGGVQRVVKVFEYQDLE